MFSKALYKQSWKANWIPWLAVVLVSSFVLTIIMLMSGGEGINSLTESFTNTFAKEALQSGFQNTAINYHYVGNEPMETFDKAFLQGYVNEIIDNPYQEPTQENIGNAYVYAIDEHQKEVKNKILTIDSSFEEGTAGYEELYGAAMLTLNPNGMMNTIFEQYEPGSSSPDYDFIPLLMSLGEAEILAIWMGGGAPDNLYDVVYTPERTAYRFDRSCHASSIFLAGNMSSSAAKEAILETLSEAHIDAETYETFGFDYEGLKSMASAATVTFQARLDFEISKLDINDFVDNEAYFTRLYELKEELQESITATILTKLPAELADSMEDMKDQDMYSMMVANMYFKIVGLLISVVYVIIVGISLVSGQVDSGSMAYVLSTGTKRNTVTFTQMVFFVTSMLLWFVTTTAVSIACFFVAPPVRTAVTLSTLVLFNVGAFLVALALAGIVYLASCIFNRSKRAIALGGGFSVLTLIFTILGLFASDNTPSMVRMDALSFFNSLSIATLYDITSITNNAVEYIWKFGILAGIAFVCFAAGMKIFKKKDLPL